MKVPLGNYLREHLNYPLAARENCIQGKSLSKFVVAEDGSITDVTTVFSTDPVLDKEARRVIKSMSGLWRPGMQDGKPVKVYYTLPISFKIDGGKCLTDDWYFKEAEKLYEADNLERAYRFFGQAFKMNYKNYKAGYNYAAVGKTEEACGVISFLLSQKYSPASNLYEQYCR